MSIIRPFCITLNDVRSIVSENATWRLPEDAVEKGKDTAAQLTESDVPEQLKEFVLVHYVALLNAAAFFLTKQERGAAISLSIVNLVSLIKKPEIENPEVAFSTVSKLTDAEFSEILVKLFSEKLALKEPEVALFNQPFITASLVLILAAVGEQVVDYAAIASCHSIEASVSAAPVAADQFTRENSPLYVSLAAQRITDITTNSRSLKKKGGNDSLNELPEIYAPVLSTIAAVKTTVAKPLHFYSKVSLQSNLKNLLEGFSIVLSSLSNEGTSLTGENALVVLFKQTIQKFEATKAVVAEGVAKGRKFYFGLITTQFVDKLTKEGPNSLTKLPIFKAQQMKKAICKEPVGTRDLLPENMRVRELVTGIVAGIFKKHGAVTIDTPVFELREVLTEKYGEESKLIYNLEDQGGELLSLRYDLTVPFARFVATHGISSIKRYQIAKVYRRDRPAIERGRFREFYQCDFDIAGPSGLMIADSEVISIIHELLSNIGSLCNFDFVIKVSHRQLLSAMTEVAGVPPEKFKTICSSVDKLDKQEWSEVRAELVSVKGLSEASADKLWEFLQLNGKPLEVITKLREKEDFVKVAKKTLDEMEILFKYLEALNVIDKIDFNLSLARGLDYYTGVILEALAIDETTEVKVGSIAGGGRYDELIGMFSGKKIPAVGASLGIERIFALIEKRLKEKPREVDTQVMVCSVFENYTKERLEVASELWKAGIAAEFNYKEKPDIKAQLGQADKAKVDLAVILAPEEMSSGNVKIKILSKKEEIVVPRAEIVEKVKALLNQSH
ncbi:histidyl-tRNA synthetase family protein [Tritrichomonas foetus]|uniref:Histidine--tRNA ligase, cytoplasmic n=1 Tax=Tritrichomonas foetus TaxID=1144522 RepID=A0A1J4KL76_9EUKA|nr:histidyl-tRNA synthetase family protein [Tritrichomonas foetus]|eukprot:OHT12063.1 histidyl-tRNA synthetase family protein [Tritrichomonas foetus]